MLSLTACEVHLWFLDANTVPQLSGETESIYVAALTESEARRYRRLQLEHRRQQFLLGKYFVRQVLSRYRNIDPPGWQFTESEHGKPCISAAQNEQVSPRLAFNLSHSRDSYTLAICTRGEVGVDVEFALRPRRIMALAKRHFSDAEIAALEQLTGAEQLLRFYQVWTLNEAFVKARGQGLSMSLRDFSFEIAESGSISLSEQTNCSERNWQFWTLPLPIRSTDQSYLASLAVGQEIASRRELRLFEFRSADSCEEKEATVLALSD